MRYLLFLLWQEPLIGQPAHPQEQELLPAFLSLIILTIAAMKMAATIAPTIIVGHIFHSSLVIEGILVFSEDEV